MTGTFAAVALVLAAQAPGAIQAPMQAGTAAQVCGRVTGFEAGQPSGCDAVLTVTTADGTPMKVLLPASVRRDMAGARHLEGAQACFDGVLETAGDATVVRVTAPDRIRVNAPGPSQAFGAGATEVCLVNGTVAPRLRQEVKPQYTSEAMRERIEGAVGLEALIDATGSVANVRVVRPLHPHLDENAMSALRQWRFAPAERDGRAVPVIVNVEMTYKIKSR